MNKKVIFWHDKNKIFDILVHKDLKHYYSKKLKELLLDLPQCPEVTYILQENNDMRYIGTSNLLNVDIDIDDAHNLLIKLKQSGFSQIHFS